VSPSSKELLERARDKMEEEDFSSALQILQQISEVDARSVDVLHEKAYCFLNIGEPQHALDSYNAAVELGGADANLWNDRAFVLLELGNAEEAVKSAGKALELEPRHYAANCNLARAFLELGDNERALEHADTAVEVNPLEEDGLYHRAEALRRASRREDALVAFRKVLSVNPHNTQARYRAEQLEQYQKMEKVRRWDGLWERWSGVERLPFVIGFLLPGILLVALGALVPTIKGGNILLFRAISISVGIVLIIISAAVMLSGRKERVPDRPAAKKPGKGA
jgi:tetratricopeptide (TPR) repeat protein